VAVGRKVGRVITVENDLVTGRAAIADARMEMIARGTLDAIVVIAVCVYVVNELKYSKE
jgi:hypothetical protein